MRRIHGQRIVAEALTRVWSPRSTVSPEEGHAMMHRSEAHRAAYLALGSLLVMAAIVCACSTNAQSGSSARSPARSHTTVAGRRPTVSRRVHAEAIAGTPGTTGVLPTPHITLPPAAHGNFSGKGFSPGEVLAISIA